MIKTFTKKIKDLRLNWFVVGFLLLGVIYKIAVTWNGNFIFQMDNARDWVDVRNMIELGNIRLTGPISAVEGLYNGPFWYYLLAIPYLLSGADPYSGVLLMILLWALGGYFLYLLTKSYGFLAWFSAQLLWIGSPYIGLTTVYSFNPNPILFLFPVFVYYLGRYIEKGRLLYGLIVGGLAGFFFNLEMLSAVFFPPIIISTLIFFRKFDYFKTFTFWASILFYSFFLAPQVLFDLKHEFLMSKATMRYLSGEGGSHASVPLFIKLTRTWESFLQAFMPTFLNSKYLVDSFLGIGIGSIGVLIIKQYKTRKYETYFDLPSAIVFITLFVTFIGFWLLPVGINSWHFGPLVGSAIILFSFLVGKLSKQLKFGFLIGIIFGSVIFFQTTATLFKGISEIGKQSNDPSNFANELRAVEYAYAQANGENFKAYAYLPSVIDYPYQYIFWWYGLKKYGYTPIDYAYLPNKPEYIADKTAFDVPKSGREYSGLIVLIMEPDRIKMRDVWEGEFENLLLLDKKTLGPLKVETRLATPSAQPIQKQ